MLIHLSIRNFALIRELDAGFGTGLHIITGETGAGKSILLGALGLVLGERADSRAVFESKDKCVIEAEFDIKQYGLEEYFRENDLDYAPSTLIRREINAQGKSRAFVNDTPVQLTILKDLGERLVDIHSQHETISLKDKRYQVEIVDAFAGALSLVTIYQEQYKKYRSLKTEWKDLKERESQIRAEYDYQSFLLKELAEANFSGNEQEEHEREQQLLENATEIARVAFSGAEMLRNGDKPVVDTINQLLVSLKGLIKADSRFEALYERLNSSWIELKDISAELEEIGENTNANDTRLEWLNERLSLIYQLQKKHRAGNVQELLAVQADLEDKVGRVEKLDEELAGLEKAINEAEQAVIRSGKELSAKRIKAAPGLEKSMQELLSGVGMPNARVVVKIETGTEPSELGLDKIELLFTSNLGSEPQPIHKVASGGELSRLMLCLKSILADNTALPTLIFDEIDTGISGEVAAKVGKLMKNVAKGHQVISITHLPQIAGLGQKHFFVYKEIAEGKTYTKLKTLSEPERVVEIARMLSGENPSDSALANARELMAS